MTKSSMRLIKGAITLAAASALALSSVGVASASEASVQSTASTQAQVINVKPGTKGAPACTKGTQQVWQTPGIAYYIWGRDAGKSTFTGKYWIYQARVGWLETSAIYKYTC